jgi:hypothetical protein
MCCDHRQNPPTPQRIRSRLMCASALQLASAATLKACRSHASVTGLPEKSGMRLFDQELWVSIYDPIGEMSE